LVDMGPGTSQTQPMHEWLPAPARSFPIRLPSPWSSGHHVGATGLLKGHKIVLHTCGVLAPFLLIGDKVALELQVGR
jgi:hypothetical protein